MGVDMSPEEFMERKKIESGANLVWDRISDQGRYNVYKTVTELQELLITVDDEFALTKKQREYVRRVRLSCDKVFGSY
tara:strand:+ start:41 stop:274 length:234 start_codon:yes stop_codon:yes gene_type:complete